ncbi:MAG: C10 family peptidase [Prevotella sp.]|nr:C10 family peptidase [Prevotella sp.]
MKRNRFMLWALLMMTALMADAAPRTLAQMKEAAAKAINVERKGKKMAPRKAAALKVLKTTDQYQIIGNEQGGFAVIAADDLVPEVLGVSMSKYSEGQNENFKWWLEAVQGAVQYAVQHGVKMNTTKPDPAKYPTQVGPLVTTKWDQGEPYNLLLPQSIYGGGRCITGCVATAMAQVLNYFQVPVCGIGSRTIYYPQGNTSGAAITAEFGDHVYDWDNMLDEYSYGNYNEAQANAVATLMRDCGVAADMQYGGSNNTENGSGAYSQDAAAGLRTYFGITEAECLERDNYSESEWMDIVYNELSENGPVYYGGASYSSGGHAFVLHGYNEEGKVYVNWGWSGDDDGYYDIALLNPGWYTFNMGQDMIIGVKGAPRELSEENVELAEAGTLNTVLDDEKIGTVGTLKITGNINSTDLRQIRRLGGIDEKGEKTDGYLQVLDLSEARIVSGGEVYLTDNGKALTTTDDELPTKAFFGCKHLQTLKLPAGLKNWGDGALGLCSQLRELEIGTPAEDASFKIVDEVVWNNDQTEIIAVLPIKGGELNIPKGTVELHNAALAGCARLSKVVLPASLTKIGREAMYNCIGLAEIRVGSKEVPELGGADVFTGITFYSCKLYVPAGTKSKYTQQAQWKNFKGSDYDNIVEYGSSVKVRNTIRKYGEENPIFVYSVSGDPITGEPVLSCEATPTSPAGKYPVTISKGTIDGENIDLYDGYLIVQKVDATATVENATREQGQPNPEFTLLFDGLVNDETVPVWVEEPVFICEATEDSPVGEYPITVTAQAESYKLTFVAGVLTVTESTTGITEVRSKMEEGKGNAYDLQGRRINAQPSKGLYIQKGKKFVK